MYKFWTFKFFNWNLTLLKEETISSFLGVLYMNILAYLGVNGGFFKLYYDKLNFNFQEGILYSAFLFQEWEDSYSGKVLRSFCEYFFLKDYSKKKWFYFFTDSMVSYYSYSTIYSERLYNSSSFFSSSKLGSYFFQDWN